MNALRTDQYTHVDRLCPVRVDLHPADDIVEIVLGERRLDGSSLRLLVDHPETIVRLMEAFDCAHKKLVGHMTAPVAS